MSSEIRRGFEGDAEKIHWKAPPRARIAISFAVFCNERNPAEVYRIVKYYLDLLKGPVFSDDKQVHYLEASIWRSESPNEESAIYIQARRLVDCYKIWDLYQMRQDHQYEDAKVFFPYHQLLDPSIWDIADDQHEVLRNVRISAYDRPGLPRGIRGTMMRRFCGIDPLVFDFGQLPSKGDSVAFSSRTAGTFAEFGRKYPLFKNIYVPVELDVQVTRTGHHHFTDLDNTATYICMALRKTLFHRKNYINGYRIYVVDEVSSSNKAELSVKLLPAGEIRAHKGRVDRVLSSNVEIDSASSPAMAVDFDFETAFLGRVLTCPLDTSNAHP